MPPGPEYEFSLPIKTAIHSVVGTGTGMADRPARRCELPKFKALNVVIEGALRGGVTRSLAQDVHGKHLSRPMLTIELQERNRGGAPPAL